MSEFEQPSLQVLDAYKAAVFARDVDAFIALYDQDVRVFDMWGEWSYQGAQAWRAMVTDWFSSLGAERVVVEFDDVRTVRAQDMAVTHAFVTYKGLSAEGTQLRAMQNRITMVLKQEGGTWKIVHEHSSAPVDSETAKVLLQR